MSATTETAEDISRQAEEFRAVFSDLRAAISKTILGQENLIEGVLTAFLTGGHVLLEGAPGLGKTLLVKSLARATRLRFSRIQFTPDLMPADITGTNLILEGPDGSPAFRFQRGPVFANIVLADEINRATPKTQSALLEAMQEHSVTVAGTSHTLDPPFLVMATQNPIEMEGTYPLPEAQLDRFLFKLTIPFPDTHGLAAIIDNPVTENGETPKVIDSPSDILRFRPLIDSVLLVEEIRDFAISLLQATHPGPGAPDPVNQFVRHGSSPRGLQAMVRAARVHALADGRHHVSRDDLARAAKPSLRHRLILNFEGEAEGATADDLIDAVLTQLAEHR